MDFINCGGILLWEHVTLLICEYRSGGKYIRRRLDTGKDWMCGRSRGYMDSGNGNGEVGVKGVHWGL